MHPMPSLSLESIVRFFEITATEVLAVDDALADARSGALRTFESAAETRAGVRVALGGAGHHVLGLVSGR